MPPTCPRARRGEVGPSDPRPADAPGLRRRGASRPGPGLPPRPGQGVVERHGSGAQTRGVRTFLTGCGQREDGRLPYPPHGEEHASISP